MKRMLHVALNFCKDGFRCLSIIELEEKISQVACEGLEPLEEDEKRIRMKEYFIV